MAFEDSFPHILARHEELNHLLSTGGLGAKDFTRYSKELSEITPVSALILNYKKLNDEQEEAMALSLDEDSELRSMAGDELREIKPKLEALRGKIQIALLPKDAADSKNIILEIRAGTGGEEAALFAADLLEMYQRYASFKSWRFEVMSLSSTPIGGLKEVQACITGTRVFEQFKFESGVHRVQRVPDTETGGRIHTSAATVAILPEAEEVDIEIRDQDLRIDVFRASGAGGQHVNTTDSAVRITHIPTGTVVSQQDEKSQHKNKAKALKILRARIYQKQREALDATRSEDRKNQVGSGDRSERIRTYNFPQGRVSDHRINLTLYKLEKILGGEGLEEIILALISDHQAKLLADLNKR